MKALKEFLEKEMEDWEFYDDYDRGKIHLAKHILSEYLTDSKFCQCELCKKQHHLIQQEG